METASQFQVALSNELMPFLLQIKDGQTTDEKVTISLAVGMFLSKQVTLVQAAELAKKSIWDFTDILRSLGIPWSEYTEAEFSMDELSLSKLAGA